MSMRGRIQFDHPMIITIDFKEGVKESTKDFNFDNTQDVYAIDELTIGADEIRIKRFVMFEGYQKTVTDVTIDSCYFYSFDVS